MLFWKRKTDDVFKNGHELQKGTLPREERFLVIQRARWINLSVRNNWKKFKLSQIKPLTVELTELLSQKKKWIPVFVQPSPCPFAPKGGAYSARMRPGKFYFRANNTYCFIAWYYSQMTSMTIYSMLCYICQIGYRNNARQMTRHVSPAPK